MPDTTQPFYYHITVKLLLLALVIALLILAREVLIPLTIAMFFTFLLYPISRRLEKWKFPKAVAILVSILVAMAFFGGLLYFFYSQILSFAEDWPELQKKIMGGLDHAFQYIDQQFNISKGEQKNWISSQVQENAGSGKDLILGIFSATGTFLASLALIPIYIFLFTFYREKFAQFVCLVAKPGKGEDALDIAKKVTEVSQKYLKGIFLDVLILSVLSSVGFLLLGLKHAILFGVLAAILNIIPYIGVLIGSILPVFMALLTKDPIYALGAAGICVGVQFIDNNFITPMVVGSSVSINPLAAIIMLVSSALIWGVFGMVLCIPLTGMLKVVCDHVETLKPYGFLLGEETTYHGKVPRKKK